MILLFYLYIVLPSWVNATRTIGYLADAKIEQYLQTVNSRPSKQGEEIGGNIKGKISHHQDPFNLQHAFNLVAEKNQPSTCSFQLPFHQIVAEQNGQIATLMGQVKRSTFGRKEDLLRVILQNSEVQRREYYSIGANI